ncbi:syncoilin-like isoform X2 [Synchiropus splendidus]|uniref:syncoilin-like isoform X2 n=1 Tax=Synchiropus splendidus TaxID=270530 RepID=UPI00237D8C1D|nr:syncoilin-like isoform X2 [Synchiropus splendidus]
MDKDHEEEEEEEEDEEEGTLKTRLSAETTPDQGADPQPWMKMEQEEMKSLGIIFDQCVQQVTQLEMHREHLIEELLSLQEPMVRAVERLRRKLEETKRQVTLSQLDLISVHEQVQLVKRRLFCTARDCIQSQVVLTQQEYEVAQSSVTKEELKAQIQSLNFQRNQLKEAHQNQMVDIRERAKTHHRPRAMSEVALCRQASARLGRRLSGSLKVLDGWYEPRMVALLKRRQMAEETLRATKAQVSDLRARLGPLSEDLQKLLVHRSSLEKRVELVEAERAENMAQFKETEEMLQEAMVELTVEFEIQKRSKRTLQGLVEGLQEELALLRGKEERRKVARALPSPQC